MDVYFSRRNRQQLYGALNERLFFIKLHNKLRFVDTLPYSRLITDNLPVIGHGFRFSVCRTLAIYYTYYGNFTKGLHCDWS